MSNSIVVHHNLLTPMIKATIEQVIREDLSDIWSVLDATEKRLVTDNFVIRTYKKSQVIYAEREVPEYLWCLLEGKAKLFKNGRGGRQQITRLIRPVEYFGYRAYFAGEDYVHTAAALETSVIGKLPMRLVEQMINENPRIAWFFLHELSRNLGSSDKRIISLTQKHIRGRLAEALIALRDHYGYEADGHTLRVYMSRDDLANLSNMTTSNAIRTLTMFVSEHLIVVDGREVKILDEASLRDISKHG